MVIKSRQLLGAIALAAISPLLLLSDVRAAVPTSQVKMLIDMLSDIYKNLDLRTANEISMVREDIPDQIVAKSAAINPDLIKYFDERKANFEEQQRRTGYYGVDLTPTTEVMVGLVSTLAHAKYDQGYQTGLANGYSEYATQLSAVKTSIAAPTDGSTPTAPPTDVLSAAISYFKTSASNLRSANTNFSSISVGGAGSAAQLQSNIESAQAQIAAKQTGNKFVDGAGQGLIAAFQVIKDRAVEMQQRPDHENDIYDQEEADALVNLANELLESSGGSFEEIATYTDTIVKDLEKALDSIVNPVEGEVPGETARKIVDELVVSVASKSANAQAAANAAAANASTAQANVNNYWNNQLEAKRIHCHWEGKSADLLIPLYGMTDEYNNLNNPEVLLTTLNSDLWAQLKTSVLSTTGQLKSSLEAKNAAISQKIAVYSSIPDGEPLPNLTHTRLTEECGVYETDPQSEAAFVSAESDNSVASALTINAKAARIKREIKRRAKKPAPKKKTTKPVPTKRFTQNVNRTVRKFHGELHARLNKAYFTAFKVYPPVPFRKR